MIVEMSTLHFFAHGSNCAVREITKLGKLHTSLPVIRVTANLANSVPRRILTKIKKEILQQI